MGHEVSFGRHRFDPRTGRLWAGRREVNLTPRAAAVLAALVERAGELVTRHELFRSVWGDTIVGDAALTACIQELRGALADDTRRPRFIETRHRRGYRFVARVLPSAPQSPSSVSPSPANPTPSAPVVGRDRELSELRLCLERATNGDRQIVFVTGEPGIGKTTAVELLLAEATSGDRLEAGLREGSATPRSSSRFSGASSCSAGAAARSTWPTGSARASLPWPSAPTIRAS